MVSESYWNRLTEGEKDEYNKLSERFVRAVLKSGTLDGYDFASTYLVQSKDGVFFLAKEDSSNAFAGITSTSKAVIETLQADAGQNYGR